MPVNHIASVRAELAYLGAEQKVLGHALEMAFAGMGFGSDAPIPLTEADLELILGAPEFKGLRDSLFLAIRWPEHVAEALGREVPVRMPSGDPEMDVLPNGSWLCGPYTGKTLIDAIMAFHEDIADRAEALRRVVEMVGYRILTVCGHIQHDLDSYLSYRAAALKEQQGGDQ